MKKIASFALVALVGTGFLSAQSLADFNVPAGANTPAEANELRKIEDPSTVKKAPNEKLGQDVFSASSTRDAANAACQDLVVVEGGARFIATGSGIGAIASGSSAYSADVKNPNLVLIAQRKAFIAAHLKAKSELAKMLKGVSVEGKQFLGEQIQAIDDMEDSRANVQETSLETGKEAIRAMLRGVIVYDMNDDPQQGIVRVSIITTPKTQGAVQAISSGQINAKSLEEGLAYIFQQIKSGLVPPDGGNTITCEDGRIAWVGYGSQVRRRNTNRTVELKLSEVAKDQSIRRARQSLLSVINGETINSDAVDMEEFASDIKQFDAVVDEQGSETIKKLEQEQFNARARMSVQSQFGSERIGDLPPGITLKTYETKDGNSFYSVAVFYGPATDAAKKLAKSMEENSPIRQASKQDFAIKPDGSFEVGKDGRLIPKSMGKGRVANDKDL